MNTNTTRFTPIAKPFNRGRIPETRPAATSPPSVPRRAGLEQSRPPQGSRQSTAAQSDMTEKDWADFSEYCDILSAEPMTPEKVGASLKEIRDRRLFRVIQPSFEKFCTNDLSLSVEEANELIAEYDILLRQQNAKQTFAETTSEENVPRIPDHEVVDECDGDGQADGRADATASSATGLALPPFREKYPLAPDDMARLEEDLTALRTSEPISDAYTTALSRVFGTTHYLAVAGNFDAFCVEFLRRDPAEVRMALEGRESISPSKRAATPSAAKTRPEPGRGPTLKERLAPTRQPGSLPSQSRSSS